MEYNEVGIRCHWCGERVTHPWTVKSGKHLFCRNGGKCKMAHARAFARYVTHVTAGSGPRPGIDDQASSKGNGHESKRIPTSSSAIGADGSARGNARKGRK